MVVLRPDAAFVASHPAHFIALGFGVGLVPVAPGTAGTLLAWPAGAWLAAMLPPFLFLTVIAALFLVGIWACHVAGQHLGASDHGAMVWDEIVAFALIIAIVPRELPWQAAAFVLFRLLDIVKPAPIRWLERRHHGGFGVMVDDIVAAGYVLLILAVAQRLIA